MYLTFCWRIQLEVFTVRVQTQKLNFTRVSLHFINPRSIMARVILTFWMTLIFRIIYYAKIYVDTLELFYFKFHESWSPGHLHKLELCIPWNLVLETGYQRTYNQVVMTILLLVGSFSQPLLLQLSTWYVKWMFLHFCIFTIRLFTVPLSSWLSGASGMSANVVESNAPCIFINTTRA